MSRSMPPRLDASRFSPRPGLWYKRFMPNPDEPTRKPRKDLGGPAPSSGIGGFRSPYPQLRRKRRDGRERDEGGVPVEPDRPNTLGGGAAAPLDFEE